MSSSWPAAERPSLEAVAARRALLEAEAAGDIDSIRAGLDHDDDRVRSSAVAIGHRIGAWTAADLARVAGDASLRVRRAVAEIAALEPDVDLAPLLTDAESVVVEVACWAAGERDDGATHLDTLVTICTGHDDALCREAAVAALGAIGDERALPAILAATRDRATVRRRAVLALAPFDTPEVDAALAAALDDRDWQVRQAAEDLQ
ncbi:MAG: HEAT repeat domain-containing protein [Acidimicrobiales bacterium]